MILWYQLYHYQYDHGMISYIDYMYDVWYSLCDIIKNYIYLNTSVVLKSFFEHFINII